MPTYSYHCERCELVTEFNFPYAERPGEVPCANCGQMAEYRIGAPMVLKASYPDGMTHRFDKLKEANKMEREGAKSKSSSTRKEIAAEIRKMGVRTSKEPI